MNDKELLHQIRRRACDSLNPAVSKASWDALRIGQIRALAEQAYSMWPPYPVQCSACKGVFGVATTPLECKYCDESDATFERFEIVKVDETLYDVPGDDGRTYRVNFVREGRACCFVPGEATNCCDTFVNAPCEHILLVLEWQGVVDESQESS